MKTITILGSTGSIGTQALEVIDGLDYRVLALAAGKNTARAEEQIRKYKPKYAAMADEAAAKELALKTADTDVKILSGSAGIKEISALSADIVLNAIVGVAGLMPTLTAIEAGSDIALANKETLVTGGDLVKKRAAEKGVKIYPVDSEHSAIFQCLQASSREDLNKIIITASGGPFLGKKLHQLKKVSKEKALRHPNWSMGAKITIDSATLMNKGLEVIEAVHLFDLPQSKVDVVVHPQSIIHSLVEWKDGAVLAQLGVPDMKIPIQYALTFPKRVNFVSEPLDLTKVSQMTFLPPDRETFGCLATCEQAINMGGLYPAAVNGANEEAVKLFLNDKIDFLDIAELSRQMLRESFEKTYTSAAEIFEADRKARKLVREMIK